MLTVYRHALVWALRVSAAGVFIFGLYSAFTTLAMLDRATVIVSEPGMPSRIDIVLSSLFAPTLGSLVLLSLGETLALLSRRDVK